MDQDSVLPQLDQSVVAILSFSERLAMRAIWEREQQIGYQKTRLLKEAGLDPRGNYAIEFETGEVRKAQ